MDGDVVLVGYHISVGIGPSLVEIDFEELGVFINNF
jgi:hypothetical protein